MAGVVPRIPVVIVIVDASRSAAAGAASRGLCQGRRGRRRIVVSKEENQVAELLFAPAKHLSTSPCVKAGSHQPRTALFLAQSDVGSVTAQNQVLDNVALFRFGDIECSLLPSKFSSRQL